jgi:predicted Zn-dependent peptidase
MNKNFGNTASPNNPNTKTNLDFPNPIQEAKRVDIIDSIDSSKIAFVGPENPTKKELLVGALLKHIFAEKLQKDPKINSLGNFSMGKIGKPKNNIQIIQIWTSNLNDRKDNLKNTYEIIYDLSQNPISEKSLQRSKEIFINIKNEEQQKSFELAEQLNQEIIENGNIKTLDNYTEELDNITTQDIQDFAKKYLDLNKASIVEIHAKGQNKDISFSGNIENNFNTEEYKLKNNTNVIIDHSKNINRATISINLNLKNSNPIMSEVLAGVIGDKNCNELSNNIQEKGLGHIGIYEDNKNLRFSISCPPEKTAFALKILKEKTFNTIITEDDFMETKKRLEHKYTEYEKTAWSYSYERLGVDKFSYEDMAKGLEQINFEDIQNIQEQIASVDVILTIPENTYSKDKIKILNYISKEFPKIQEQKTTIIPEAKTPEIKKSEIYFDETDEEGIINIIQDYKTPKCNNSKDQMSLKLLGVVLRERMFKDLRESQNICYMIEAEPYINNEEDALLELRTKTNSINPKNAIKAIDGFNYHSQKIMHEPVSQKELNRAKNLLKNAGMSQLENSEKRNTYLSNNLKTPYKENKHTENLKAIKEITPEHIQRMAQMIFNTPSITVIEIDKANFDKNKNYFESQGNMNIFYPNKEQNKI